MNETETYIMTLGAAALARLTGRQTAKMVRAGERKRRDKRNAMAKASRRKNWSK